MPAAIAETIIDTAERLFAAIEGGDRAAVDRLWSDDIAVWRASGLRDPARPDDKLRALRVIDWFITATSERHYEILDRQLFGGGFGSGFGGGFVQQHVLHATGRGGQSILRPRRDRPAAALACNGDEHNPRG